MSQSSTEQTWSEQPTTDPAATDGGTPDTESQPTTEPTAPDGPSQPTPADEPGTTDPAEQTAPVTQASSTQDGSVPTDVAEDDKPVWDVSTHGPLGDDDARRNLYRVINEQ